MQLVNKLHAVVYVRHTLARLWQRWKSHLHARHVFHKLNWNNWITVIYSMQLFRLLLAKFMMLQNRNQILVLLSDLIRLRICICVSQFAQNRNELNVCQHDDKLQKNWECLVQTDPRHANFSYLCQLWFAFKFERGIVCPRAWHCSWRRYITICLVLISWLTFCSNIRYLILFNKRKLTTRLQSDGNFKLEETEAA